MKSKIFLTIIITAAISSTGLATQQRSNDLMAKAYFPGDAQWEHKVSVADPSTANPGPIKTIENFASFDPKTATIEDCTQYIKLLNYSPPQVKRCRAAIETFAACRTRFASDAKLYTAIPNCALSINSWGPIVGAISGKDSAAKELLSSWASDIGMINNWFKEGETVLTRAAKDSAADQQRLSEQLLYLKQSAAGAHLGERIKSILEQLSRNSTDSSRAEASLKREFMLQVRELANEENIKLARTILANAPDDPAKRLSLASMLVAKPYVKAIELFIDDAERRGSEPSIVAAIRRVKDSGEFRSDIDEATRLVEKLPSTSSSDDRAIAEQDLGTIAALNLDFGSALDHYLKAWELAPRELTYFNNAIAMIGISFKDGGLPAIEKMGKPAMAKFTSGLKKTAGLGSDVYLKSAKIAFILGDTATSETLIKSAMNRVPDDPNLWLAWSTILAKKGRWKDAREAWNRTAGLASSDSALKGDLIYLGAVICDSEGDQNNVALFTKKLGEMGDDRFKLFK